MEDDEEKKSSGGSEGLYIVLGLLALVAIAPFILSTLNPSAIPGMTYAIDHYDEFSQGVKRTVGWLVGISFPISIAFLIMIIYCVERLKHIRNIEKEKFDMPIEQAYVNTDSEGDPALAHRWSTVTDHIESENPNDWKQAILEADIMLDDLLTNMGYRGESIGEKLKRVDSAHFQTLQDAWDAHTVRNRIAHEGSTFPLNQIEARRVIQQYRKVFEEFYFI